MKKLTVFTPTYNRVYCLPNVYKSLCHQTSNDFIWIVVDDGSTDNTTELVRKWISENIIKIVLLEQKNGGKQKAHNNCVRMTNTDLFVCVDSDDFLVENAVELILNKWNENSNDIAGIVAYKGKNENETLSGYHFININKSTLTNLYETGFRGDTTLIYRTDILKNHLYPEVLDELHFTDSFVYDQIDQRYSLLVFPQILEICEYLEDGTTFNALRTLKNNPKSYAIFYNQKALFADSVKNRNYYICQYICYCILGKTNNIVSLSNYPLQTFFLFPFGKYLSIKRKLQYKKEVK